MSAPPIRHQRILASAGSGKTYRLTSRFLTLLVHGAPASTILASTFTRQAAGQILQRLLLRLVEALESEQAIEALRRETARRDLDASAVRSVLASLCRSLHRVRVRTLDSVLASIVGAFSLELGLPPGCRVIDEIEDSLLRDEAMQRMLDETHTQRLVELLRQLTEGDSGRSVVRSIDAALQQCYDLWRQSVPGAWEVVRARKGVEEDDRLAATARLASLAESVSDANIRKRVVKDAMSAMSSDWEEFLDSGLVRAVCCEGPYYRKPVADHLRAAYEPLIAHATAVEGNLLRAKNLASRELVEEFHQRYESLKRELGAVTFADLSYVMAGGRAAPALDDVFFRLDGAIQHILLDEFQDTSLPQWRSIEPLVREAVSHAPPERTLLVVGDLKQSIYGWRSGEPRVLADLPGILGGRHGAELIEDVQLTRSYRSDPAVIEFVNRLFEHAESNEALVEHAAAATEWSSWFTEHESRPNPKTAGFVQVRSIQISEQESAHRSRIAEAARLAAELHSKAPTLRIGVLFRRNKSVMEFMNELASDGVSAAAVGGGFLTDSSMVNLILDALRVVDHPGDTVAAFNVAHSPLAAILGVDARFADTPAASRRLAVARALRRRILHDGLSTLVASWVGALAISGDARDQRRLRRLTDMAAAFDRSPSVRLSGFVRMMETMRVHDGRSAPIQAMTVHQAKGLEFDAVILPELEGSLKGGRPSAVVHERADPLGDITAISAGGTEAVRAVIPELKGVHAATMHRTVRESLCVVYVAMTRAASALYLLVDHRARAPEKEKKFSCTAEGFVRAALSKPGPDESVLFQAGDPGWIEAFESDRPVDGSAPVCVFVPPPRRRAIQAAVNPSAASFQAEELIHESEVAREVADPHASQHVRDRGIAIHLLFQQVEWIENFRMDQGALTTLIRSQFPRRSPEWIQEQVAEFGSMLGRTNVAALLRRPSQAVRSWRERPFARIIDGQLQSGVFDRLVCLMDGDQPNRAEVIDFKSEQVTTGSAVAAAEQYRGQLQMYRDAAAEALRLPADRVDMRVVFVTSGDVVTLA